jgi:hypothetical protein
MTQQDNNPPKQRDPLSPAFFLFTLIFVLAWTTWWLLFTELVINPRLEAQILARAKSFPELDQPHFDFFPVIYNQETHMISPFNTTFDKCFGLSHFYLF